ncbi:hypothetical protein [Butyrivibrio sp. TB]|uniref:hypothetical protein n=1 Tax=Butyrivibrio sp. TB TaxID=1520809 RepID=UPI0008B99777|nr:hypothetical protein [Butyrivibrio sp. TB]SEP62392.1 hypothetical protein SAMN02910382_00485 [Butyrivibrio sp. TB]
MKKFLSIAYSIFLVTFFSSTAYAAPTVMSDGGIFDAEYYAASYPDVAAVVGTDSENLYAQYNTFGKYQGLLPYEGAVNTITINSDDAQVALEFAQALKPSGVTFNPTVLTNDSSTEATYAYASGAVAFMQYIKSNFKDPYSAKISALVVTKFSTTVQSPALQPYFDNCIANLVNFHTANYLNMYYCISASINAKNSFGAYTGYKTYIGYCNSDGSVYNIICIDSEDDIYSNSDMPNFVSYVYSLFGSTVLYKFTIALDFSKYY